MRIHVIVDMKLAEGDRRQPLAVVMEALEEELGCRTIEVTNDGTSVYLPEVIGIGRSAEHAAESKMLRRQR